MSNPTQNKPGGKSGQRNRKPDHPRGEKPAQPQNPKPAPQQAQKPAPMLDPQPEPLQNGKPTQPQNPKPAPPQAQKPAPLLEPQPEPLQNGKPMEPAVASTEAIAVGAAASPNTVSIDLQTIATAYSDYSKKSFEQTRAFVEKLSGARSIDKVIEIQTEFAKQAYETFVTESQKIRELYSGLARQAFRPLESLLAKTIPAAR
jgi:hypothetical protein